MSARVLLFAAFDLLVNAIGSFLVAAIVVALAVRAFRLGPGRTGQALWTMPFVKVLWDAARGIPADAFFWARLAGTRQRLGTFQVGAGLEYVVPKLHFGLAALTDQGRYPSTIADLAAGLLSRRVAPDLPAYLAAALLGVGAARIASRLVRIARGEGELERLRASAELAGVRRAGRRDVEVRVSPAHRGAPFTGGLLRPYVCFPAATFAALSPAQREACIEHELAHVARRDLVLATALDLLGDVLWFVPALGAVRRRIDASCEHLADLAAVRAGASPLDLAAALVRVRDALSAASPAPAPSLVRRGSQLAQRVAALLGRAPAPRWGFHRPWPGALLTAWIAAAALLSALCGHR